ncbi:hypothetical protein BH11ACT8_BH11ACT8_09380 [soil metagenome]
MRRALATSAALLLVLAGGVACGSDSSSDGSGNNGSSTATEPETIDITVAGGEITPNGTEVDVAAGQQIDLVVTADAPGEIHVHSEPEHEYSYEGTGEPETFSFTIDRPGQVEVESHTLDKLIVKLVVS